MPRERVDLLHKLDSYCSIRSELAIMRAEAMLKVCAKSRVRPFC